jgi:hypothetical protein
MMQNIALLFVSWTLQVISLLQGLYNIKRQDEEQLRRDHLRPILKHYSSNCLECKKNHESRISRIQTKSTLVRILHEQLML